MKSVSMKLHETNVDDYDDRCRFTGPQAGRPDRGLCAWFASLVARTRAGLPWRFLAQARDHAFLLVGEVFLHSGST